MRIQDPAPLDGINRGIAASEMETNSKPIEVSATIKAVASLSVIMPVFNEERWLDQIFERVTKRPEVFQIVAVDDSSTDRSWEILKTWQSRDSRIKAIWQRPNLGKGAAIRHALKHTTAPIILIQDADLEYDPRDYAELVAPIIDGRADVVFGSRFIRLGTHRQGWHAMGNRLLTFISNQLTGLRLTDEATCYKVFRRELLERLVLSENGFGFCPEVTAKIARLVRDESVRLVEVPVNYQARSRAEGKKIRFRDGLNALRCLLKYRRNKQ